MSFWTKLFKKGIEETSRAQLKTCAEKSDLEPEVHYEEIPGTLDLGWYYSKNKDEFQMVKIAEKDRAAHFKYYSLSQRNSFLIWKKRLLLWQVRKKG